MDDVISRHDRIRDGVAKLCSTANLSLVIGKPNVIANSGSRPGYIFRPSWSSGRSATLDITATSLQPNLTQNAINNSGYATEAAEEDR